MSDPYVGEIRMVSFDFAPSGWAFCDGQALSIFQNDALYALIGTTYGGDGMESFNLPDFQGRAPLDAGTGLDQITYTFGERGGTEQVTLAVTEMPLHVHPLAANSSVGNQPGPSNGVWAGSNLAQFATFPPDGTMAPEAIMTAGGGQPHDNMMPFTTLSFIIALVGNVPTYT